MIAFVQANAPFFTWTGAVFVASVAVGLGLWAVSELWAAFWKWLDPYDLALLNSTSTYNEADERCENCGQPIGYYMMISADGQERSLVTWCEDCPCGMTRAAIAAWRE